MIFLFLIINLDLSIAAVITKMFNPTEELKKQMQKWKHIQ